MHGTDLLEHLDKFLSAFQPVTPGLAADQLDFRADRSPALGLGTIQWQLQYFSFLNACFIYSGAVLLSLISPWIS